MREIWNDPLRCFQNIERKIQCSRQRNFEREKKDNERGQLQPRFATQSLRHPLWRFDLGRQSKRSDISKRSPSKSQAQGFRGEMQRSRSKNKPTDEHYKALETKYQQQLDGKAAWKVTGDSEKGRGRERNQREVWMPARGC
jgi:hypothetical protein